MRFFLLSAALILPATAPAVAAEPESGDPNKLICKKIKETGSRLSTKRICMTAAEWAEHKRNTRQDIDKAQTTQINKTG